MPTEKLQPTPPMNEALLRSFTKLVVVCTLFLIYLGGQVKSNEAGLSVPDWPTTYGQNMFLFPPSSWVGGIFHEHVHRLVASSVGFLSMVLAIWLYLSERRKWVAALGIAALASVMLQGLLGGMTVWFLLPAWLSTSHAVLAQTFLLLAVLIAYTQSREWSARERAGPPQGHPALMRSAAGLLAAIYLQLFLGALMRHTESGLAIPDFPRMGGQFLPWFNADTLAWINNWRLDYTFETGVDLPSVTLAQVLIHFSHRVGAIVVVLAACLVSRTAFRNRLESPLIWRTVCLLDGLLLVQLGLAAFTLWTAKMALITSLHVVMGAVVLALAGLLMLRVAPLPFSQGESTEQSPRGVAARVEGS